MRLYYQNNRIIFPFLQADSDVHKESDEGKFDPVEKNDSRNSRCLAYNGKGKKDIFSAFLEELVERYEYKQASLMGNLSSCISLRT